jgi:hypothetical protein
MTSVFIGISLLAPDESEGSLDMFLTKSLSREDRNLNLIAYFQVERSKIMYLWFQLCLQAFQPKQTGTVHKYCVEMILS